MVRALAIVLAGAVAVGCSSHPTEPEPEPIVFAAASASDTVQEALELFESKTGIHVRLSAAGSNTLATQITNGAPASVFISADEDWVEDLKSKGHVVESEPLLSNKLVVVVPRDSQAIKEPNDLLKLETIALAGESVPAGKYAREALESLHLTEGLSAKIANASDVRGALTYVELGEAQAAIVYATDARVSKKVKVAFFLSEDAYKRVVYPIALCSDDPLAREVFEFLKGDEAAKVFASHGFSRIVP